MARARAAGLSIAPRQIFQHQTVAELAAVAEAAPAASAADEPLDGDVPLTPIQRWFFDHVGEHPHHWNQSVLLELRAPVAAEALEAAVVAVAEHHEALRLRFTCEGGVWRQRHGGAAGAEVARVDLSGVPDAERAAALSRAAGPWQARLHLSEGPLLRAVLFDLGAARRGRLLLVAHHLVVDAVSWRILLEDLETALRQRAVGEEIRLPARTTAFGSWARRLAARAQSEEVARQADAWIDAARGTAPLPADDPAGAGLEGDTVRRTDRLDEGETRALLAATSAYRARVDELLLTALGGALARWTGEPAVLVEVEGHGRDALDDADVSRTVGWFTSLYPVRLEVPPDAACDERSRR
ncbi:hypothetical protein BE20_29615 [Sorangium cellulosum]|nr:hypothetical protein BE20_29615 [Sorangium cellulosum]